MNNKAILITEKNTILLFNQVRGKVISEFPEQKITDEKVLAIVLEEYKNGRK